jgi:adenylate kinase family enzyme
VNESRKRIIIIGCAGAGKSQLAIQLGRILGLNVIHLDRLFWHKGWVETPRTQWRSINTQLVRQDAWIIDGNYYSTLDIRLAACDTVIFMDFPRHRCLWNVIKRVLLFYGKTRPDIGPGCPEKIDWEFVQWIWNFPKNIRPRIYRLLDLYGQGKDISILKNQCEVEHFLQNIKTGIKPPIHKTKIKKIKT